MDKFTWIFAGLLLLLVFLFHVLVIPYIIVFIAGYFGYTVNYFVAMLIWYLLFVLANQFKK